MTSQRRSERIARSRMIRGLTIAVLLGFIVAAAILMNAARRVNPRLGRDLCPEEALVVGEAYIFVDATDPWSEIRRAAVAREVGAIGRSVPRFTRVFVFVVSAGRLEGPRGVEPVMVVCNPGSPEQVEADAGELAIPTILITNPRRAAARYDSAFADVLDSVVAEAGRAAPQDESPIIETIRRAVLGRVRDDHPSVFIISDMYQNSRLCSFYRPNDCISSLRSVADVSQGGTHDLAGASVEILLLSPVGGERVSRDELIRFWESYFALQGSSLRRVKRIEQ